MFHGLNGYIQSSLKIINRETAANSCDNYQLVKREEKKPVQRHSRGYAIPESSKTEAIIPGVQYSRQIALIFRCCSSARVCVSRVCATEYQFTCLWERYDHV